jgi:uncharacterized protein
VIIEIIQYRNDGLTIREIASEMNLPIGKVQYQWNKYRKDQTVASPYRNQKRGNTIENIKNSTQHSYSDIIDQCVLMVQSTNTLFGYWELSSQKKNAVGHHLNEDWFSLQKKLRLYDITAIFFNGHNAHRYLEYSLPENCKQWFFYHLTPNRTYCVDIGVITKDGSFFPLLRSNPIDTPRSTLFETGLYTKVVSNWKDGKSSEPEWLEGFSSYSYYEKLK